jgi:hypothetical protein
MTILRATKPLQTESTNKNIITALDHHQEDIAATRDYSKLRKAASSQSLSILKEAISKGGWTARDIDDNDAYNHAKGKQKQRLHASKSALHMAAWKGCLDNVKYLVEEIGCDVDAYSKQEFSYGKTAIFFALTQSRPDVTEYLLERGAKVTIVNNKGQSVLSIATTHFHDECREAIVQTIQRLEEKQGDWWNFRASHSDGFEYGDLDPRFFSDRPLRDTDVVTPLVINPTDQQTRRGGFLRRNPGAPKWKNACRGETNSKQKTRRRAPPPALSPEERGALYRAWETLLATPSSSHAALDRDSLLEILRLSDKQRASWIPQATNRLTESFGREQAIQLLQKAITKLDSPSQRQIQLLTKLLGKLRGGDELQVKVCDPCNPHKSTTKENSHSNACFDSSDLWRTARDEVQDLCMSSLEEADSPILALPNSPFFVDTPDALRDVLVEVSNAVLVAIDTEWYTPTMNNSNSNVESDENGARTKPKAALSTLQIAMWNAEKGSLRAFVVDLTKEGSACGHPEYRHLAKSLVEKLLDACCDEPRSEEPPIVLGFAIAHDLPMLEVFRDDCGCGNGERETERQTPSSYARVLDLQSLLAMAHEERQSTKPKQQRSLGLPGLKACVARYSSVPLSKECQCSDWGQRPLSEAQLDYAGLDAAILLVLLAERSREEKRETQREE